MSPTTIDHATAQQCNDEAHENDLIAYEFTVQDTHGRWLEWYPLAVESDEEAERCVAFWRGKWRRAPVGVPVGPNNRTARRNAAVERAQTEVQNSVPRWRARLSPAGDNATADDMWSEEAAAMKAEIRDLRTLINTLVDEASLSPTQRAQVEQWISLIHQTGARLRAAGDDMGATLLELEEFLQASGVCRRAQA